VQTTLFGIAIAVIVALVAALVAPYVVDWSRYRALFEEEASRLTGLVVHVEGPIDARILPLPQITLRDVTVGEDGHERMRAAAVDVEVALSPLLRGEVRATELRLIAPRIELGLDRAGSIDWPAPAPGFRADALSISRFDVEDGRIVLSDTASGARVTLQKLSFGGDIRSFLGPFHGAGRFVVGEDAYAYRISGGRVDEDGGLKLRLAVDPSNYPLTTEIEGQLSFAHGLSQFDGGLTLSRPVAVTLAGGERVLSNPWQLAGKVRATPSTASLRDLALQYGPEERAVNFTGTAKLTFGEHPHLNGEISARQVDVDRMLAAPDVTRRPPLVLLKEFLETFTAAVRPPLPVSVGVAIDALTVGGTAIQSLHGNARYDDSGWGVDEMAFRAPGLTEVSVSGRLSGGPQGVAFSGPARVEAADLKMLMAWLEGRAEQAAASAESMNARADVTFATDRFVLDRLSASFDQETVDGRLAYTWATRERPATLDGALRAARLNVDALFAFANAATADGALEVPREVALVLDIGKATFAGVDARAVNARLKLDSGILHVDRLSVGDLGGAALDVNGRIEELSSRPRGRLTLDIDASTLAGLVDIVGRYAPPVADALRPFVERLSPAKVHGVVTVDRAAGAASLVKLELGGSLGALRLSLNGDATAQPAHVETALLHVNGRFDADDGAALVRLLKLDQILAVDQLPGQMTISASGPLNGSLRLNGAASAGGFSAIADGALRLNEGTPTGSLQLRASASDLRPLRRAMTGQAGAAVPISGNAIVGIAGRDLSVTDLAVTAGKSALRGRLDLTLAKPVGIAGEVAADEVDAAAVAAMLLGLPSAPVNAGKLWSAAPVGGGAFGFVNGAVNFKFERAALTQTLIARDLTGVAQFRPLNIVLSDLQGTLAGGRLSGSLTFRHDPQALAAQGNVELAGANAAAFAAANSNAVDGKLTVKLQGESEGLSPDGVIGAFHGGGTIALTQAQFGGVTPAAFDAAIRVADQSTTLDAAKIKAAVAAAMDSGRFLVLKGEAEVTIAAGQMQLRNAKLKGQNEAVMTLDGLLDLNNATLDTQLSLSSHPAASTFIPSLPELAVSIKGPLAAPERKLDTSTLISWLTLRATEQQTRRLESLEVSRRQDVLGAAMRPLPPSVRIIPQGTPLEINNHVNVAAAPVPGANALDRLRSEAPAAAAALPPAGQPAAKPPSPQPAVHSPLDLLFHSQN
jgi:large subunit ribosomal protein L24